MTRFQFLGVGNVNGAQDTHTGPFGIDPADDCPVCTGWGGTYHPAGEWITCHHCGGLGLDCD